MRYVMPVTTFGPSSIAILHSHRHEKTRLYFAGDYCKVFYDDKSKNFILTTNDHPDPLTKKDLEKFL